MLNCKTTYMYICVLMHRSVQSCLYKCALTFLAYMWFVSYTIWAQSLSATLNYVHYTILIANT